MCPKAGEILARPQVSMPQPREPKRVCVGILDRRDDRDLEAKLPRQAPRPVGPEGGHMGG